VYYVYIHRRRSMKKINSSIIFILLLFTFFNIELSGYKRSDLKSLNLMVSSIHKKLIAMELKSDNIKKKFAETKMIRNAILLRSLKKPDKKKFNNLKIQIISEKMKMIKINSLMKQLNNNMSGLQSEFSNLNKEILKMKKMQRRNKLLKSKIQYIDQLYLNVKNLRKVLTKMNFSKLKKKRKYLVVKTITPQNLKSPGVIQYKDSDLGLKIKNLKNLALLFLKNKSK